MKPVHIITPEFREKIKELRSKFPSENQMAMEIGVAHTTLRTWLRDGILIRPRAYESLIEVMIRFQIIRPEQTAYFDKQTNEKESKPTTNAEPYTQKLRQFPIISDAAAAECNRCYMPIADYAESNSEGTVGFSEGKPGDFVLRITGNSMLPWYPEGTLVLARPNQLLHNGDRVIAVLNSGEVIFKIFAEQGDCFYLLPINEEDGKEYEFKKNDFTSVRAIYTIIQSMRDEQAIDRAMSQAGIKHSWQKKLEELSAK